MQKLPLTGLPVAGVTPDVIVCGDPGRADRIADRLEKSRLLSEQREYRAYRGEFAGLPLTVCSHGIGAPGAAIAFEELIAAGARRLLRIGSCGGLRPEVLTGHLVVATAAVDRTGYGRETVPTGYPAVADPDLMLALRQAVRQGTRTHHTGLVLTRDNFYEGVETAVTPDYQVMSTANVLAVEMECAALFVVGSLRGVRTGAILVVDGNVLEKGEQMEQYDPQQQRAREAMLSAVEVGLQALVTLAQEERK